MKQLFAFLFVLMASFSVSQAQRFGYVDSEMIMSKIPEYQAAQDEIESASEKWQLELEELYKTIEQLYSEYQAREVLMSENQRQEKQEEIFALERQAKEYREEKFGQSGEIFRLQDSKVKPIQDRVFTAVEAVATRKRIDFVFDKAGDVTWMFTNTTYDLSNDVLNEMGYKQE